MAERRINRRSQAMQNKLRGNPPVILEEDERSQRTEQLITSKSKEAAIEVTVKVKKRRDKPTPTDSTVKLIPLQDKEYRKGSWGDLLSSSRTSLNPKDDEYCLTRKKEPSKDARKLNFKDTGKAGRKKDDDHSPMCQKIPISDDLYLETHTHFRKSNSADRFEEDALLRQNEELRKEVFRLRREMEISKVRSSKNPVVVVSTSAMKTNPPTMEVWKSDGVKTKRISSSGTQTSTACLLSPKKGAKAPVASITEVDKGSKAKRIPPNRSTADLPPNPDPATSIQIEAMKSQNEELRQQISNLLIDINKTRSENCEFVNTIKELYQTADALTQANRELQEKHNMLILNHHGQQALQDQLLQIVTHNVQMKETLETLMNKQGSPTGIDDSQLAQFRNVIKDVKSTIAQEMQGLARLSSPSAGFLVEKDVSKNLFDIRDSCLNDTNASEIQKILSSHSPETRRGRNAQEERSSSTQYLNIDGFPGFDSSHYRPSPLTVSKFSPRISTPNSFSNFSLSLTEADASALQYPSGSMGSRQIDDKWKALEDEVSRSFIPLRNELSNCSTSSYSSGSTASSPNPMMMK